MSEGWRWEVRGTYVSDPRDTLLDDRNDLFQLGALELLNRLTELLLLDVIQRGVQIVHFLLLGLSARFVLVSVAIGREG